METTGRLWAACHDYTAQSGSTGSLSPGDGSRCYSNCVSDTQETMKALQLLKNSAQKMPLTQVSSGKLSCELTGGSSAVSVGAEAEPHRGSPAQP